MAAGAVGAFKGAEEFVDATVDVLACLLDVMLGLRKMDPVLDGRVAGGCWIVTRVVPPLRVTLGRSTMVSERPSSPRMLPWPVGDGNWVSLKSVDADSKLLWRSSKLTDGRKSNEPVGSPVASSEAPLLGPKEKRVWLFDDEALSIGASKEGCRTGPFLVGLALNRFLAEGRDKLGLVWCCDASGIAV